MPVDIDTLALVANAREAARAAYAPYSNFGVGATVLLSDGRAIPGANFENASYGLTLCAEAVALAAVNMAGGLAEVIAIAVVGGRIVDGAITGTSVVRPCGRCRQLLNEAAQIGGRDIKVICAAATGKAVERHKLSALLPLAFGPADLEATRT